MKNPHTKLPGYVIAFNDPTNGWLVVFDRRKIEDWSQEREQYRWLVRHIGSGKSKAYSTQMEARSAAYRGARSLRPSDQFWNEN